MRTAPDRVTSTLSAARFLRGEFVVAALLAAATGVVLNGFLGVPVLALASLLAGACAGLGLAALTPAVRPVAAPVTRAPALRRSS